MVGAPLLESLKTGQTSRNTGTVLDWQLHEL